MGYMWEYGTQMGSMWEYGSCFGYMWVFWHINFFSFPLPHCRTIPSFGHSPLPLPHKLRDGLTEMETEIDAVGPLDVLHHRARLPPAEVVYAVEVRQVVGRMGLFVSGVIAEVARLGRPRDPRLLVELFRASHPTGVRRFHRQVEGGVHKRRQAALRLAILIVAEDPVAIAVRHADEALQNACH